MEDGDGLGSGWVRYRCDDGFFDIMPRMPSRTTPFWPQLAVTAWLDPRE